MASKIIPQLRKPTSAYLSEILLAFNNKLTVGVIFCGLERVFDSVNHDILLQNVNFMESGTKPMHC